MGKVRMFVLIIHTSTLSGYLSRFVSTCSEWRDRSISSFQKYEVDRIRRMVKKLLFNSTQDPDKPRAT